MSAKRQGGGTLVLLGTYGTLYFSELKPKEHSTVSFPMVTGLIETEAHTNALRSRTIGQYKAGQRRSQGENGEEVGSGDE